MLADVADASKHVRFGVAGVGVCEVVMCTKCAYPATRSTTLWSTPSRELKEMEMGREPLDC